VKTVVVYDSVHGNTERIAQAIGDAIPGEVPVLRVGQVDASDLADVDLLILGSPTHGAEPTEAVRSLIQRIGSPTREGARAALFDTRFTWRFLKRWGFAAPKMADTLQEKGWTLAGTPEGFFVKGLQKGPLKRGEVGRATAWARGLVESLT
jgi:flavodoxin